MSEELYYHSYFNRDRLVHIVDPDRTTCDELAMLFRIEGFQTATSLDGAGFYAELLRRRPDVVVVNLGVGPEGGLSVVDNVKSMRLGTIVFLTVDQPDVPATVEAMRLGASDVLNKPIDRERLVRSVRDALRRDIHLGAMREGRRPVEVRGFGQLTSRERQVLQLITNGSSNKEAGRELGISPRTVEVHRARVMEKLGARNTADLLRIVLTA